MSRRLVALIALLCGALACSEDGAAPEDAADVAAAGAARFVAVAADVVRDARSGLDWTRRDAGRDLDWQRASAHCTALELAAHRDWRLPSVDELAALYDEERERPCGKHSCRVDPAFELGAPYFWTDTEPTQGRRFYVDLRFGTRLAPLLRPDLVRRVLCVRGAG